MSYGITGGKLTTKYIVVRPPVTSITLSPDAVTVRIGEKTQLTATVDPSTASRDLIWKSSKESVATVDADGIVTGIQKGYATIIAMSTDGSGIFVMCEIEVLYALPQRIEISPAEIELEQDSTTELTVRVIPETANQAVTWRSDDNQIATVSADGIVTGIGEGLTKVWATSVDVPDVEEACQVKVNPQSGIEMVKADGAALIVEGNEVYLRNFPVGSVLRIWKIDGTMICTETSGRATVTTPGVYIARADQLQVKFIVK